MQWTLGETGVNFRTAKETMNGEPGIDLKWADVAWYEYHEGDSYPWWSRGRRGFGTLKLTTLDGKKVRFHFNDLNEEGIAFMDDFLITLNRHNNFFVTC